MSGRSAALLHLQPVTLVNGVYALYDQSSGSGFGSLDHNQSPEYIDREVVIRLREIFYLDFNIPDDIEYIAGLNSIILSKIYVSNITCRYCLNPRLRLDDVPDQVLFRSLESDLFLPVTVGEKQRSRLYFKEVFLYQRL